ncbi:tetracycline resistance MFS efflux pump [soil metagenome]
MGKLVVLMFTAFVDMVGFIIVWPLLPFYAADLGANDFAVGLLISAFSVAQLLSAPAWGRFSDRRGRRPAILLGLMISAGAYVVFAFADSLALLLVSRVVQGIGGGTIGVVQAYVADSSAPEDRAKSLGWLSAATSLGAIIGPAIGSLLVQLGGRSAPGLGAATLCLGVAVFAWKFLQEPRYEIDSGSHTATHPITGRAAVIGVLTHPRATTSRLILIYAIAIGGFYGTGALFPLIVAERFGITESTIGYLVMYFGGMGLLVRATILGPVVERVGEVRLCRVGLSMLALGLALLGIARTWPMLIASITLMPLGTAFTFPCVTAMLTRAIHKRERGLYLGVQATYGGISRVAFPLLGGLLMEALGRGTAYVVAGFLVAATLPLAFGLTLQDKKEAVVDAPPPEGSVTAEHPVAGSQ